MKNRFSRQWISSKKPNKQRKYRYNAPLHLRGRLLSVHMSKDLRQKHGLRSIRVRIGDKVKIMRGQFRKQEGKVEDVDTKKLKLFIVKIEHTKRDGTKARHPIDPSNVMLMELNIDDKKRALKLKKLHKVTSSKVDGNNIPYNKKGSNREESDKNGQKTS